MRTYGRWTCTICGREISNNGLARTSHMRWHVRRGEATEIVDTLGDSRWYRSFRITGK